MSQSLVKNLIHVIFSTKDRRSLLDDPHVRIEMNAYMMEICTQLKCPAIIANGSENHIHLLCSLSKNISGSNLIKEVKRVSSIWIKTKGSEYKEFYWQGGYAYFSVSPKDVDAVVKYIGNQEDHHKIVNFKDELRAFLMKYEVTFDENYLWD